MTLTRLSEYEARVYYRPTTKDSIYCDVTVDYVSKTLKFSGTTVMDLQGTPTTVKASGAVTLYGAGEFELLVGDDTVTKYYFVGIVASRPF
jgi:hypothetical protein